jgi:TusA-related sulfurtransferase
MDGSNTTTRADKILDLGTEGCSHLLENIADALKDLRAGQTLLVIASDPAAPLDIKVWSRQTGNTLLNSNLSDNQFLIQKK